MSEVGSAYVQLWSVGLLWISFHCTGMCGPLLIGLDVAGAARGLKARRGAFAVVVYQGGKALTYSLLGATAGAIGGGARELLESAGGVLALSAGVVLAGVALRRLRGALVVTTRTPLVHIGSTKRRGPLERATLRLSRALLDDGQGPFARAFTLGIGMGLLPCMIPLWVLGLAAVTGSPLAGAGLMLSLVVMTTPVLLIVTLLPRAVNARRREAAFVPPLLLSVSATWLVLVGLASFGVVPHVHLPVPFGSGLSIMLW